MLVKNSLFPSDYHEELAISLGLLLRLASGVQVVTHVIFFTSYSLCIKMELAELSF